MATLKVVWLAISQLISFHEDENISRSGSLYRDDADRSRLALSFAKNGYDLGIGNPLIVYKLGDDRRQAAIKQLDETWDTVQKARDDRAVKDGDLSFIVTPRDYEAAWRRDRIKADKIIIPPNGIVAGHRRYEALTEANAYRDKMDLPPITEVPCLIRVYDTDLERYEDCVMENTLKNVGTRNLSEADKLMASNQLYCKGCKEKRLVIVLGSRQQGQKHHAIMRLNQRAPNIGLLEGLISGDIKYGPIDKDKTRNLAKRIESEETDPKTLEVGPVLDEIRSSSGKNASKMASKDDITGAAQNPVQLIEEVLLKGVIGNDLGRLSRYIPYAPQINAAVADILSRKPEVTPAS